MLLAFESAQEVNKYTLNCEHWDYVGNITQIISKFVDIW